MTATRTAQVWMGGRPLREAYGDLFWRRSGMFRRELILEAGSERLASLVWPTVFSFEAQGESADGRWILSRSRTASLLGGCVVRQAVSGAEVATYKRSWRGTGTAMFASGAEYTWGREGFWRARYFWIAADQRPLVTFQTRLGLRSTYEMSVEPSARTLGDLPVLVLLGGYVMALASAGRHAA